MDDLISRQAAIDAMTKVYRRVSARDNIYSVCDLLIDSVKKMPHAQPEPFGAIKHAGLEHPLSDSEIIPRLRQIQEQIGGSYAIDRVIELLTAQHIDADGTLWITVTDIERVKRVIVDEEKSKFCRQFYMDAQPEQRTGKWLWQTGQVKCNQCLRAIRRIDHDGLLNFCPNCGTKMEE